MKAIGFFFITALLIIGAQAQDCNGTHEACKRLSMGLNAADTSQRNECVRKCSTAKKLCAAENKIEKLRSASGHHLNCVNSRPRQVTSLSKRKPDLL